MSLYAGRHPRGAKAAEIYAAWAAEREVARKQLLALIDAAFADTELEGGTSLHQARRLDDYSTDAEVREARNSDPERSWRDISDEKVERFANTLAFMDAKGFRFYAPRFMVYALQHATNSHFACDAAYYSCDPSDTTGRLALFSTDQRKTLEAFAKFVAENR